MTKGMHGNIKTCHVALAGVTVILTWAFVQVMLEVHYGREYFAAVIGKSGQTADVSFVSKPMRRVGTIHCILAYLFNTTVLALLLNTGAAMC
jgi:uncharacterized membrane protein